MKGGVGGVASPYLILSSKRTFFSRAQMVYFLGWSSQGHMVTLGQSVAKGIDLSGWLRPIPSHVRGGHRFPHTWALLTGCRGDGLSRGHCGPALLICPQPLLPRKDRQTPGTQCS